MSLGIHTSNKVIRTSGINLQRLIAEEKRLGIESNDKNLRLGQWQAENKPGGNYSKATENALLSDWLSSCAEHSRVAKELESCQSECKTLGINPDNPNSWQDIIKQNNSTNPNGSGDQIRGQKVDYMA